MTNLQQPASLHSAYEDASAPSSPVEGDNVVRLLFLRHGDAEVTPHSYPDHETMPLSELGRRQAEEAAEALAQAGVARIVSSPLRRAVETAETVGRVADVEVEVDPRLAERVFPPLFGMPYFKIEDQFGVEVSRAVQAGDSDGISLPGVEELRDCARQVHRCVRELVSTGRHPTLVVFHGGPHEWLLTRLLEIGDHHRRRWFTLGKCRMSAIDFRRTDGEIHRLVGINVSTSDYALLAHGFEP